MNEELVELIKHDGMSIVLKHMKYSIEEDEPDRITIIASVNDITVGDIEFDPTTARIIYFIVEEPLRRKGIATKLFKRLLRKIKTDHKEIKMIFVHRAAFGGGITQEEVNEFYGALGFIEDDERNSSFIIKRCGKLAQIIDNTFSHR